MSKVHQAGTLEVQSPPSIFASTKLIGCAWPAKAGWPRSFHSCSSACSADTSGKQASIALAPEPAVITCTGRPRTLTWNQITPTCALISVSPKGSGISAASPR